VNYKFGATSLKRMEGVDPRLVRVATRLLDFMDVSVQQHGGVRLPKIQKMLFDAGASHKDGYLKLSNHQTTVDHPLGRALDLGPHPLDWNDIERFCYMGGLARAIGASLGTPIRWLGDKDSDGRIDKTFRDFGHIELVSVD
jgi:hypothetical protein